MSGDRIEARFADLVDNWVGKGVAAGANSFGSLVRTLPGVYPSDVRDSLLRLRRMGRLASEVADHLLTCAAKERRVTRRESARPLLPVPHPLDFDWRYANAAIEKLLNDSANLAGRKGSLALIGAPSVTLPASKHMSWAEVVVLDSNSANVDALRRACPQAHVNLCDVLREPLPATAGSADVVIADPPWYPAHVRSFLWAACWICRPQGHILVSLPPLGTRPGMADERDAVLALVPRLGLALVRLEEGTLPYVSPLFERNALKADGICSAPAEWRRGDLAVLVRQGDAGPRPAIPRIEQPWLESDLPGFRVRLRRRDVRGPADPTLRQLISGDVLPTVSRRDPRRRMVDVWTSGNRVFACQDTGILRRVFEALGSGKGLEDLAPIARGLAKREAQLVEQARVQATALIRVEQDEQSRWHDDCSEEASAVAF